MRRFGGRNSSVDESWQWLALAGANRVLSEAWMLPCSGLFWPASSSGGPLFFGVVGAIAGTTNDSRRNEIDRLHGHGASRAAWSSWRRRELAAGAHGQHGRKQRGPDAKLIK